jgi:hypothetical protein
MKALTRSAFWIIVLILFSVPVGAAYNEIGLYLDTAGGEDCILSSSGAVELHVVVKDLSYDVTSVGFTIDYYRIGMTWLADTWTFPGAVGNSNTGVTIDFGGCETSPLHVLTALVIVGAKNQGDWIVIDITSDDCTGQLSNWIGSACTIVSDVCEVQIPTDPSPPDGATDIPSDTDLSWSLIVPRDCPLQGVPAAFVYLGTTPDPPRAWPNMIYPATEFHPPYYGITLLPNTTYYWKIEGFQDNPSKGEHTFSPVWFFTTGGGVVPVKTNTWGAIKSLYR